MAPQMAHLWRACPLFACCCGHANSCHPISHQRQRATTNQVSRARAAGQQRQRDATGRPGRASMCASMRLYAPHAPPCAPCAPCASMLPIISAPKIKCKRSQAQVLVLFVRTPLGRRTTSGTKLISSFGCPPPDARPTKLRRRQSLVRAHLQLVRAPLEHCFCLYLA